MFTEHPQRFFAKSACLVLEVSPAEEDRPQAQPILERAVIPFVERECPAAIVVSQRRKCAVGPRQMHQELQHAAHFVRNRVRKMQPVLLRQHHRLQVEIERITVITGRELPIYAIVQDLLFRRFGQQGGGPAKPDGGPFLIPKHQSGNEQGSSLADQMRVGAAEERRVPVNMLQLSEK